MNALELRNTAWKTTDRIPGWVRGREIGLDQYNTLPEVAKYCWDSLQEFLKKEDVNIKNYHVLEPSAGIGAFYDLLPKENRIGIDVENYRNDYIQHDFLTWEPKWKNEPCIAIGNPPFGYRGWLALAFINRAAEYCDYVGFILPMSFQSEGKGSPKNRVQGMILMHSEKIPTNSFVLPNGKKIGINTLWQIWKKGEAPKLPDQRLADEYIELFTVDFRKERRCGMEKIQECNTFLQRSYFNEPPRIVNDFSKVKYVCGYGILFKKDEKRIRRILEEIDWSKYNNLAAHSVKHISMYHIKQALLENLNVKP